MKPTELRSGNYVNVPHGDVQIDHFIKDGCHFTDGCGGTFASLHPIPLTEEWLKEKTEFKFKYYTECGEVYRLDFYKITIEDDRFFFGIWNNMEVLIEFKYVHQLQNLYFALTGKELEIK